jgi:hypothetical protein
MQKQTNYWEKAEVITQILILVFAVVAVFYSVSASNTANSISKDSLKVAQDATNASQVANNLTLQSLLDQEKANNLTQTSILLQNMTSNFEPLIIDYFIGANLQDITSENGTIEWSGKVVRDEGSLNMSLVVITPHAAIIGFSNEAFNFTAMNPDGRNDTLIDPNNPWSTYASIFPYLPLTSEGNQYYGYPIEAFVQLGVTQVNFTIPVSASFMLNPLLTDKDRMLGTSIGNIEIEVSMFDVQTRTMTLWNFPTQLRINFNCHYGENFVGNGGLLTIG